MARAISRKGRWAKTTGSLKRPVTVDGTAPPATDSRRSACIQSAQRLPRRPCLIVAKGLGLVRCRRPFRSGVSTGSAGRALGQSDSRRRSTGHPHAHGSPTNVALPDVTGRLGQHGPANVLPGHGTSRHWPVPAGPASRRVENRYRVTPCRGFESHALRKQKCPAPNSTGQHRRRDGDCAE
jgi:hypothetical protein